ncbi:hypothetical protein [Chromobacterium sp.]|uniref:hypothetical protein n=1 Tax=Chromobacterium sp. TaxID=306190 RepID=UPI0035B034F0
MKTAEHNGYYQGTNARNHRRNSRQRRVQLLRSSHQPRRLFLGENNFTAYISVLPLEIELLIEGGFDESTVTIALEICTPDGEIIADDFSTIQSPKENVRKTITPYLDTISSRFITEIKNKKQSPSAA